MTSHELCWVTGKFAQRILGVSGASLIHWANTGKIPHRRTPGGHRQYDLRAYAASLSVPDPALEAALAAPHPASNHHHPGPEQDQYLLYARVSTRHQSAALATQSARLRQEAQDAGWPADRTTLLSDIGSGLNFKRRGFGRLVDKVLARRVRGVMVTHRDRLCRFGGDLLDRLFAATGTTLTVLHHGDDSPGDELADDVLAVITHFSAVHNGRKRYSIPATAKKAKEEQAEDDAGAGH
jgi:predicted site-specific integrase-resolvase